MSPADDVAAAVERVFEAAAGRMEELERERDTLLAALADEKRVSAERLEALRPFAREAEDWSRASNGGHVFDDAESASEGRIRVGDLRRAAALVTEASGG